MGVKPFPGFQSFETHHCITGSIQHIYHFHDHPLSEDMILGLGSGLGFIYWHAKGMTPMLGGRGNVWRPGVDGLEIDVGRCTGVVVERFHTTSARKARSALLPFLEAGQPVMIHVDMGYLPYLKNLPEDFHFGYHLVVVAGYDPDSQRVLIADRDQPLHPISMEDLEKARGSTFKPFPPLHTWYQFDFSGKRPPKAAELRKSIQQVCESMLKPPISNVGVKGIRKAAERILQWPESMEPDELRWSCFNAFVFIDAEGGTGGGLFRYMYSRFLAEAADLLLIPELRKVGAELSAVGDRWQEIAVLFKRASKPETQATLLEEIYEPLMAIAELEQGVWTQLCEMLTF